MGKIKNQPGSIWGLFNILKHNHWRFIKKRLPHKKLVGRKHSVDARDPGNSTKASNNDDDLQAHSHDAIGKDTVEEKSKNSYSSEGRKKSDSEEKSKKHTSETKGSVRNRIKALLMEDKSKRKGRHYRSSSYPVQSNSTGNDSLDRLEPSDQNPTEDEYSREFNRKGNKSPAYGSLNPLFLMSEESSSSDCDDSIHIDGNAKKSHENDTLLQEDGKKEKQAIFDLKSMHAKESAEEDVSPRRSKAFLDALNLINMNKEFLLKVLQDPGSPLARHFQSQQAFGTKMVLTKAGAFPAPGSSGEGVSPSIIVKQQNQQGESLEKKEGKQDSDGYDKKSSESEQATPSTAEYRADGIQKLNQTMASGNHMRKRGKNQVVVKRFKDLRQKIRHAIRESKNEQQRITMDAVLDKVPRKYGFSKDLKKDVLDQFKDHSLNTSRKEGSRLKCMRRTSSLSESLDRYLQLYECSFQKDAKTQTSEKPQSGTEEGVFPSRRTPKTLARILSLPEIKTLSHKSEGSLDTSYSRKQMAVLISLDEQETADVSKAFEDHIQLDDSIEGEMLEHLVDSKETCSVSENQAEPASHHEAKEEKENCDELTSPMGDPISHDEQVIESPRKSFIELDEDSSAFEPGFTFDQYSTEFLILQEHSESSSEHPPPSQLHSVDDLQQETSNHMISVTGIDLNKSEFPSQEVDSKVMQDVHVEANDKEKFYYVKDVLELSGFNSYESLATWHSDHQPMDPSVYEEVTGCMLQYPDCSGNEEGGNCNHLLLFDLINEALIEIYERCYHYYPMVLSNLCHIHPMPFEYGVLKEVWVDISWHLRSKPEDGLSFDHVVSRDLSKGDSWMNLQFDSECVGLEVEDLIFDELLEEVIFE